MLFYRAHRIPSLVLHIHLHSNELESSIFGALLRNQPRSIPPVISMTPMPSLECCLTLRLYHGCFSSCRSFTASPLSAIYLLEVSTNRIYDSRKHVQ